MTRHIGLRGVAAVLLAWVIVLGCRGREEAPRQSAAAKPVQPSAVETSAPSSKAPVATRTGTPKTGKDLAPSPSESPVANAPVTIADVGMSKRGGEEASLPASNPFIGLTTEELRAKADDLTREEQTVQQRVAELKQKWSEGNAPADTNDAIREADYRALNEQTRALMLQRALLQRAMDSRAGQ